MLKALSGKFKVILLGNVRNMMLHANAATLYFICGLCNVVSGNYSVRNSPLEGRGTIDSERPIELHFTFLFGMGLPCSTSNN